MARQDRSKHRRIYDYVHGRILAGKYGVGQRIPTETELASQFASSRVTVARALRDLEQQGFLRRHRGAGSFVCRTESSAGQLLGLIAGETPGIMATVCDELARVAQESGFGVLLGKWTAGDADQVIRQTESFCREYIERKVTGVIFMPMLLPADQMIINRRIAEAFDKAGILVVLLDRDIVDYPHRSRFDLVGTDNVHCGYRLTRHLLDLGYERIHFIGLAQTASAVTGRAAGYELALEQAGIRFDPEWIHRMEYTESEFVSKVLKRHKPDAFVCANDYEAAKLMRNLVAFDVRVPEDVAVVGVNDDPYSALLNVPLTTIRQPCSHLGASAVRQMMLRLDNRSRAPQEVRLTGELVVRESCGAKLRKGVAVTR